MTANNIFLLNALKAELQRVSQSHKQLVEIFETRLAEYGIPHEELGFEVNSSFLLSFFFLNV